VVEKFKSVKKIKPETYFLFINVLFLLVCLYKFRKKRLFLGGIRSGQNVILWGEGNKEDIPPPPRACMLKKALILVLSLFTLHNVLHQYLSNYLFIKKNTKQIQKKTQK
jgi:hypothetical protein